MAAAARGRHFIKPIAKSRRGAALFRAHQL
jgi:hypothetical protein